MTTLLPRLLLLMVVASTCAACGGSSAPGSDVKDSERIIATCDSVKDGTVTVAFDYVCANCGVSDEAAVADDDAYSYATIIAGPAEPDGIRIRVTAPDGVVFPAGSDAGAFFTGPAKTESESSNASLYQMEGVRTYLDGVRQETEVYGETGSLDRNWAAVPTDDPAAPRMFRWIHTTKAFDAVEFVVTNAASYGNDNTWKLHELCSNGWVDRPE